MSNASGPLTRFRYNNTIGVQGPQGVQGPKGDTGAAGSGTSDGQAVLSLTNGLNSNIPLSPNVTQRIIGPTAPFSMGGLAPNPAAVGGQRYTFINSTTQTLTIEHEHASSTATNRIDTQTGRKVTLVPRKGTYTVQFDGTAGRWVLQNVGYNYTRGFDVREFTCQVDGSTDDRTNLLVADAAAQTAGTHIVFPPGITHVGSSTTLLSDVEFAPGAQVSGTFVFNGAIRAHASQQIFTAGTVVTLGATARVHELWVNWWGAKGDGVTNCTAAFRAAAACALAAMAQAVGSNGVNGLELRVGGGQYNLTSNNDGTAVLDFLAPIGLRFRGVSRNATTLFLNVSYNTPAFVRFTNYVDVSITDMSIMGAFNGYNLGANVAVGATTVVLATPAFGALRGAPATPLPLTLWRARRWYERLHVTNISGDGLTLTLDRPTRYKYYSALNDFATPAPHSMVQFYSDAGQAMPSQGISGAHAARLTLGNPSICHMINGIAFDCAGGSGSASDNGNSDSLIEAVIQENATSAGLYIGHRNSLLNNAIDCAFGGGLTFIGIHAPHGGNVNTFGCGVGGLWASRCIGGPGGSHIFQAQGDGAEARCDCPLLADTFVPQDTWLVADFVQPAPGGSVTITVKDTSNWIGLTPKIVAGGGGHYTLTGFTSTTITMTRGTCHDDAPTGTTIKAGTNVGNEANGQRIAYASTDTIAGPQNTTVAVGGAASGQKIIPLTAQVLRPGQWGAIAATDGTSYEKFLVADVDEVAGTITTRDNLNFTHVGGAPVGPAYMIDLQGSGNGCSLLPDQFNFGTANCPGFEVHVVDSGSPGACASSVRVSGTRMGCVGWTLDNAVLTFDDAGWTVDQTGSIRETYYNGAQIGISKNGGQANAPTGGPYPLGKLAGVRGIYGSQAAQLPKTIDTNMKIHVPLADVKVAHADSPFTLSPDTNVYVDTSGGNVVLNLPTNGLAVGEFVTIIQNSETAVSGSITVNRASTQTLEKPVPNRGVFQNAIVWDAGGTDAILSLGASLTWKNAGSGAGKLLVS